MDEMKNKNEYKHIESLRKHLAECTVLLNSNGDFPMRKAEKIALYGSGARHTIKGGTGSGDVNSRYYVTVEQGLKDVGFEITTNAWLDAYDNLLAKAKKDFVKDVRARAKQAHVNIIMFSMGAVMPEPEYELPLDGEGDTAIYVLSRISGEGSDRRAVAGDIFLSETEKRDILALNDKYKKFMLVLNVGGPVDLSPVKDVKNILVLSQLGVETGSTLADIILGKNYPSGKLTTTWTAWEDYSQIGEFGNQDDVKYTEGVYVGYRYFDSVDKKVMYPFGFGLGYTDFSINVQSVDMQGTSISVNALVRNEGKRAGKETVQLYVSVPEGKLDQPYQSLAGFAKSGELKSGEIENVNITFDITDIASYDAPKASYVLEKGDYVLRIGNSSQNTNVCAVIRLDEDVCTFKVKNALGDSGFADWKPENKRVSEALGNTIVYELSASKIAPKQAEYDKHQDIDSEIKALTNEELAYLNIGAFEEKGGVGSIIGNAGRAVAGAAGETTGKLLDKKIPALVMADGPAGLRLSRDYIATKKGAKALDNPLIESMTAYLSFPLRLGAKLLTGSGKRKRKNALHQYATAIPIGTAIAQSWNIDFAKLCGDIVGDEMQTFGVHLWLAPALNIHRSICCGRNFEYYSEDPLVSGKIAAAITLGVQKHKGCGTTIKHYAANNQETNRYNNNSKVSERAMREIYLKGFEICVKESQPKALMTSYNLLNGVHTSERRDLIEDILRSEFGYEGIVMTDWVIAGFTSSNAAYPAPEAYKVAAAGNDIFMPGSKNEFDNIIEALNSGKIDRKPLEINAARVVRMIKELA